jgi:CHAT domain-containing protein
MLLGLGGPSLAGGGRAVRSVEGLLDAVGAIDPGRVRGLAPLEATLGELAAMRDLVGAAQSQLVVGDALREDPVRNLAWRQYRIVTFATHGFVAAGEAAPGQVLVLTPPAARTATDDGVLSSTEIRALQLDADLVILSACDTGAVPEGAGASGSFAEAFVAAGARTVVVSRWPLLSDTAALLTTPLVREAAAHGPGGVTAAERSAILALLAKPTRPALRHPMFWAAFSVVGDTPPGRD